MNKFLYLVVAIFSLAFLASCQTLSKEECLSADWRVIGEQDGASGANPQEKFRAHAKSCEPTGVRADQTLWNQGYQRGLIRFCTPVNGVSHGENGRPYYNNCPVAQAGVFSEGYELGRKVHSKRGEINSIKNRIKSIERSIESKEKRIREGKIDQREAESRIDSDRRAINELNRELGRKDAELGVIKSEAENFKADYQYYQPPLSAAPVSNGSVIAPPSNGSLF
ncbi:MAG: DUF2799 domain-containing protein [Nitratireductor sp.]